MFSGSSIKALTLTLLLLAALFSSGCNTVQGVGKDVQRAGQALERTGQQ